MICRICRIILSILGILLSCPIRGQTSMRIPVKHFFEKLEFSQSAVSLPRMFLL